MLTRAERRVAEYRAKGLSTREIGRLVGLSQTRVVQILAQLREMYERSARN
jgi:DNA-binding CsgD family transcriptional regulator